MSLETLPVLAVDLIDELDKMFPEKTFNHEQLQNPGACASYSGARELVKMLISIRDQDEELKGD